VRRGKGRTHLEVTADGTGVAGHADSLLVAEMADATGLTDALSVAMAPICRRRRRHDPGRVLVDLAVMLADGEDCLSHVATPHDQPDLFGSVASSPTAWRVIEAIDDERLGAIREARATARGRAWAAGSAPSPATAMSPWISEPPCSPHTPRRSRGRPATSTVIASTRSGAGWTAPVRLWPPSCARAVPARAPRPTMSP